MSLTGTDRGVGGESTSREFVEISPASNCTAGALVVLCIAYDNTGTLGVDPFSSIIDSIGNEWTSRQDVLNDPGAAAAGVCLRIFTTLQDVGTIQTGTVITITFGVVSVAAKVWTIQEFASSLGISEYVTGNKATASTASPTITSGSIPVGHVIVAAVGIESGTTQTETGDSDSTRGVWSTQQVSEIGSTTSGMVITSQRKVITTTGTQTYNPTFGISGDLCIAWIEVREAITVTPGVVNLAVTTFTPLVIKNTTVVPGVVNLAIVTFVPTIVVTNHQTVVPGVVNLVITSFAPIVTARDNKTVVPGLVSLAITTFAPIVVATNHQTVVPGVVNLVITSFAPEIQAGGNREVVPSVASLSVVTFAPTILASNHQTFVPGIVSLVLVTFVPQVVATNHQTVVPDTVFLVLTFFDPIVSVSSSGVVGSVFHSRVYGSIR